MGKKKEISNETINKIIDDSKFLSIRKLSTKFLLNKNTIIRILNNKKINNNIEYYICKKTKKKFFDIENKSGSLTKHLSSLYDNVNMSNINLYFDVKYSNNNVVNFSKYINSLRITYEKKELFSGLHKYTFKSKNVIIFFIENNKISLNKKIKPIFLFKLKERYINSIFIYEDEWSLNSNIVQIKIKTLLNINKSEKIFARKCNISIINEAQKKTFLNKYHIQGTCNSTINYGAFYNDKLIAVMTFTTYRNMTNDAIKFDYELNRFATNINYLAVGVGSKIFKSFLKSINGHGIIVSYGDRRWVKTHKKNLYTELNFKLNQISKHDYTYIKPNSINRIHKITVQQQIKNNNINEKELLEYKKIWDCGKYRYTYRY